MTVILCLGKTMISSVKASPFGSPASAARMGLGSLKLPDFGELRVEEVCGSKSSGRQDESFIFNDLNKKAALLAAEAMPKMSQNPAEAVEQPDPEDLLGDDEENDEESLVGGQDRRAAGTTEHDQPPQGLLADGTTVLANDFTPPPGLDTITGRDDTLRAARAYESVLTIVGSAGMRLGDVIDSNL